MKKILLSLVIMASFSFGISFDEMRDFYDEISSNPKTLEKDGQSFRDEYFKFVESSDINKSVNPFRFVESQDNKFRGYYANMYANNAVGAYYNLFEFNDGNKRVLEDFWSDEAGFIGKPNLAKIFTLKESEIYLVYGRIKDSDTKRSDIVMAFEINKGNIKKAEIFTDESGKKISYLKATYSLWDSDNDSKIAQAIKSFDVIKFDENKKILSIMQTDKNSQDDRGDILNGNYKSYEFNNIL